jgi:hypothetical protein
VSRPILLDRDGRVLGGPGEAAGYRHVWAQADALSDPVAACGAPYDGRPVLPGANKHLPVCELCKQTIDQHNAGARLGGRIEVDL